MSSAWSWLVAGVEVAGLAPATVAIAFGALFFGGFVKGCVGLGQPTATFLVTANFLDPFTALTTNSLPMVAANVIQAREAPSIMAVVRREKFVLLSLVVGLSIGALLLPFIRENWVLIFIGVVIGLFCLIELSGFQIAEIKQNSARSDSVAGLSAGILGGLTTLWAAPLLIYYAARRLEKEAFVQTVGVILLLGSLVIVSLFVMNGIMTAERFAISALGILPAVLGYLTGRRVRRMLSADSFRRLLLFVFLVGGCVITYRGLFLT